MPPVLPVGMDVSVTGATAAVNDLNKVAEANDKVAKTAKGAGTTGRAGFEQIRKGITVTQRALSGLGPEIAAVGGKFGEVATNIVTAFALGGPVVAALTATAGVAATVNGSLNQAADLFDRIETERANRRAEIDTLLGKIPNKENFKDQISFIRALQNYADTIAQSGNITQKRDVIRQLQNVRAGIIATKEPDSFFSDQSATLSALLLKKGISGLEESVQKDIAAQAKKSADLQAKQLKEAERLNRNLERTKSDQNVTVNF